jgi:hypothetical protein
LTASPFSSAALNQARLALLQQLPGTRLKAKGVLSIDDTLLTHWGHDFEEIAQLYDPVSESYVWAHDLVTLHYSDDQTAYPVHFQLWRPVDLAQLEAGLCAAGVPLKASKNSLKQTAPDKWRGYLLGVWRRRTVQHPELEELHATKLTLAKELLQQWVAAQPDLRLPVTFDNWYTQAPFCRFLDQTLQLAYVGTLAEKDKIHLKDGSATVQDFAARLKQEHLANVKQGGAPVFRRLTICFKQEPETYYSYCQTHRLDHFGTQRLVINHRQPDLSDNPVFLISNRLVWQAAGITRIRRHRWPVEVYHEEGKAEGLDQYQLRGFDAIQRHVALVAVVYSLLRAAPHDPDLRDQLQRQLQLPPEGSAAAWRRATQAQSLWCLGLFIMAGLAQGQTLPQVMAPLIAAMCRT